MATAIRAIPTLYGETTKTFVTRTKIPFGEGENPNIFEIRYGHFY